MIALYSQVGYRFRRPQYRKRFKTLHYGSYTQQMAPPQHRQMTATRPCASKHLHPWEYRDRPKPQPLVGPDARDSRAKRKMTISKMWKLYSLEERTRVESTPVLYPDQAPMPDGDVLSEELRTTAQTKTPTQMSSCKRYVS